MPRLRHHVNPLGSRRQNLTVEPVVIPRGKDVEVELGCADARFLFERAKHRPEAFLLGIEIREPLVAEVNELAKSLGLWQLRAVEANINVDLDTLLPDGVVSRFFINFPDPWFKRRHHKRRLVTDALTDTLIGKLKTGGEIFFQTDIFELGLEAMTSFEKAAPRLLNQLEPWSFFRGNDYGAQSLREVRAIEEGLRIWRMTYQKQ